METGTSERVGQPSTRRRRRRTESTTPRELSTPPRTVPKRRKREKIRTPEREYPARRILEEKREQGRLWYLIDWEDDQVTGESWPPSWVSYGEVGKPLVAEWQQREKNPSTEVVAAASQQQSSEVPASPESDPIPQPSKRKRTAEDSGPESGSQSPQKKPRKAGTVKTARFQSVSQETVESQRVPSEIKDSYEGEEFSSSSGPDICVEVPAVHGSFDRNAYAPVASSQTTQSTQLSQVSKAGDISVHASVPSAVLSPAHRARRGRAPFIWDEDFVVPDSQEPGSLSYQPIAQASSSVSTELSSQRVAAGYSQLDVQSQESQLSLFLEDSLILNSGEDQVNRLSSQPQSNQHSVKSARSLVITETANKSNEQVAQRNGEEPRASPLEEDCYLESAGHAPAQSVGLFSELTNVLTSSQSPVSSPQPEWTSSSRQRTLPRSPAGTSSQSQHRQPSQAESSSASQIQFQTQVPFLTDFDTGDEVSEALNPGRSHETPKFEAPQPESRPIVETPPPDASGSEPASRLLDSSPDIVVPFRSEKSKRSPVSTPSQPSTQRLTTTPRESQAHPALENISQEELNNSLREVDPHTQRSPSASQENSLSSRKIPRSQSQYQRALEAGLQNCDNVLQSIEGTSGEIPSGPPKPSPPSSSPPFPETYGSNLPPRPSTASSNMDDQVRSSSNPMDTASRLKQIRAAAGAAHRAASSSPSLSAPVNPSQLYSASALQPALVVPPEPPSVLLSPSPPAMSSQIASSSQVYQMLPVREPAAEMQPILGALSAPAPRSPHLRDVSDDLLVVSLGPNEHIIPLPLTAATRSIYAEFMTERKSQIRAFLSSNVYYEQVIPDIDDMLKNLEVVCDHSDLTASNYNTQKAAPDIIQARWAETTSTKCIFVAEFLDALRDHDIHVGIVARPGRMIEILEALLRWHNYSYTRPDVEFNHSGSGGVRVTLLPGGFNDADIPLRPARAVIVFDPAYGDHSSVKTLRTYPSNPGQVAPLISLVVIHSIEHLDLCLPKNENLNLRKRQLVNCLFELIEDAGKLNHEFPGPSDAAKAVAEFLIDQSAEELWPLPPLPEIKRVEIALEEVTDRKQTQQSGSTTQSYNSTQGSVLQPAFKRHLATDDSASTESSKRQRLTPAPGEPQAGHVGRTDADSSLDKPGSMVAEVRELINSMDALDNEKDSQAATLTDKINDLQTQILAKESTTSSLEQQNTALLVRCTGLETSISRIQPRYQEALNDRGQFEYTAHLATSNVTVLQRNVEVRIAEIKKLREEKAASDAELLAARNALSTSTVPEIAAFAKLEDELRTSKAEIERLQKRLAALQSDMEYVRGSCQEASSAAAAAAHEVKALEKEVEVLTEKADVNSVRIHEVNRDGQVDALLTRVESLEGEKEGLERELEKKAEELRVLQSGRRATRGTSVPRSPRMGTGNGGVGAAGMSPRGGGMGRILGSMGSRGSSPAPGSGVVGGIGGSVERGGEGPLRGAFMPAEALFQGPPVARWGTHLQ